MTTYPALLARQSGNVHVTAAGIEFIPDPGTTAPNLQIPMMFLQAKTEGRNSDFVLLYNRNHPEVVVSVQDLRVISALTKNGFRHGGNFGWHTPSRRRFMISTTVLGSFVALLFVMPFLLAKMSGNWIINQVTPEVEKKWIRELMLKDKSLTTLREFEGARKQMQHLVKELSDSTPELKPFDVEIIVNDSTVVNAFAIPGGILMINTGFIKQAESTEEVLGVLAHELGHIERRHNLKSIVSGLGITTGAIALSLFLGADVSDWIVRGSSLLNLKYTRDHEREADMRGLQYLKNARYSPHGMIQFFERLGRAETSGAAADLLTIISTHPSSAERIRELQKKVKEDTYEFKKPSLSIEELKSSVHSFKF